MAIRETKGFLPVVAAIGGNFFITVMKFIAASMSGSSAMLSEGIHSLADTINQVLLLIGLRRSEKKADDSFEYGYGNERFFWALISACGVLFVGAGVTGYNGIEALSSHGDIEFSAIVFLVLFLSFLVESYTLYIAAREIKKDFPNDSWRARLRKADPSTLAVFLEDIVAVLGIVLASASILLAFFTKNLIWDAIGSLMISGLLGVVAVILIIKNRSYLIGMSIPEDVQEEVTLMLQSDPAVEQVVDFKSSTLGFGSYRIKCEVEFNGSALLREAYEAGEMRDVYESVQGDFEEFKRASVEYADRIPRLIGRKIDDIEMRIKKRFPSIKHIDIEVN